MDELVTIYTSNFLIDCYIFKGRLETESIPCYLFDEHIVSVHPFYAVAVRGVKVKVPAEFYQKALVVRNLLAKGILIDNTGEYSISEALQYSFEKTNEILSIKNAIRKNPELLQNNHNWRNEKITEEDYKEIITEERLFQEISKKQFVFDRNKFLIALFDPDIKFFQYLRPQPVEYFLDKELVDRVDIENDTPLIICPYCHSSDVSYNYAIDNKFDILYILLSLIFSMPFYPFRRNNHCFNCNKSFN